MGYLLYTPYQTEWVKRRGNCNLWSLFEIHSILGGISIVFALSKLKMVIEPFIIRKFFLKLSCATLNRRRRNWIIQCVQILIWNRISSKNNSRKYNGTTYYESKYDDEFGQLIHIDDWPQRDSIHQVIFTTHELHLSNETFCKGISKTINGKIPYLFSKFQLHWISFLIYFFSHWYFCGLLRL